MSAEKKIEVENAKKIDPKDLEINDLKWEIEDLIRQNSLMIHQYVDMENRYNDERQARRDASHAKRMLEEEVKKLTVTGKIKPGDVIVENFMGTGANLVASGSIE